MDSRLESPRPLVCIQVVRLRNWDHNKLCSNITCVRTLHYLCWSPGLYSITTQIPDIHTKGCLPLAHTCSLNYACQEVSLFKLALLVTGPKHDNNLWARGHFQMTYQSHHLCYNCTTDSSFNFTRAQFKLRQMGDKPHNVKPRIPARRHGVFKSWQGTMSRFFSSGLGRFIQMDLLHHVPVWGLWNWTGFKNSSRMQELTLQTQQFSWKQYVIKYRSCFY